MHVLAQVTSLSTIMDNYNLLDSQCLYRLLFLYFIMYIIILMWLLLLDFLLTSIEQSRVTWSCISALRGEMMMDTPPVTRAGSW